MPDPALNPTLVPLSDAILPYRGVSVRSARALIAAGRLPGVKVGRCWLVSPGDVARLFAPTVREPAPKAERTSPTARSVGQLREAGFEIPGTGGR